MPPNGASRTRFDSLGFTLLSSYLCRATSARVVRPRETIDRSINRSILAAHIQLWARSGQVTAAGRSATRFGAPAPRNEILILSLTTTLVKPTNSNGLGNGKPKNGKPKTENWKRGKIGAPIRFLEPRKSRAQDFCPSWRRARAASIWASWIRLPPCTGSRTTSEPSAARRATSR